MGSSGRGSLKRDDNQALAAFRNGSVPLVHWVTAEIGDVLGQHRADEVGHGMLRLADGKRNQGLAGLMRSQQLVEPDEGRAFAIGASTVLRRTG